MPLEYINSGAVAAMNGLAEVKRKYRSTSENLPKKSKPKAHTDLSDDSSSINGAPAEVKVNRGPKWQSVWDMRTDKAKKKRKPRSKEVLGDSDLENLDDGHVTHEVEIHGSRSPPPVDRTKKPKRTAPLIKPPDVSDSRPPRPPPPNLSLQIDSTISSPPRLEVPKLPKGKKLLDVVAQKDLETLQRSMFENETFFEIVTKKTYDDVKNFSVSPWVAAGGERRRQMSYNFPKTIAFSTHDIHIEQIQIQASYSQPGVVYGIDCVTKNRGVMYSDYFEVHIHFRLTAEGQSSSRLVVTADIVFVKPCLFKSKIETEGWSGLKKYYEMVEKEIQNERKQPSSTLADQLRPPVPKRNLNHRSAAGTAKDGGTVQQNDTLQLGAGFLNVAFFIVIVILTIITFAMFRLSSSMVALSERLNSIEDMIERYALVCHSARTAR